MVDVFDEVERELGRKRGRALRPIAVGLIGVVMMAVVGLMANCALNSPAAIQRQAERDAAYDRAYQEAMKRP